MAAHEKRQQPKRRPPLPPSSPLVHHKPRSEDLTWNALTQKGKQPSRLSSEASAKTLRLVLRGKLLASVALIVTPAVHTLLVLGLSRFGVDFHGIFSWLISAVISLPVIFPVYGWASRVLGS